ncbi:MAG: phage integrase SAM-like domain-containing protein [Planctomycetales bacterium]|nr:phage integrase SAM-like domain-containing protein [Planctomycetales bacterium]
MSIDKRNGKWRVRWRESDGRARSKSFALKTHAKNYKARIENELSQSTYLDTRNEQWGAFVEKYKSEVLSLKKPSTRMTYEIALNRFEELCKPHSVSSITAATIDKFIAKCAAQCGLKKKSKVSPTTVNEELRVIRSALRKAAAWKHLRNVPKFN